MRCCMLHINFSTYRKREREIGRQRQIDRKKDTETTETDRKMIEYLKMRKYLFKIVKHSNLKYFIANILNKLYVRFNYM